MKVWAASSTRSFVKASDWQEPNSKHITADKVLFLYRESYYINYDEPTKKRKETEEHFKKRLHEWENRCQEVQNLCEILIAKNNDGTCGCVNTYFNPSIGLFKDYPDEPDDL